MDASYKIQRGIHVHLIQFFMCPEFWVHIRKRPLFRFDIDLIWGYICCICWGAWDCVCCLAMYAHPSSVKV